MKNQILVLFFLWPFSGNSQTVKYVNKALFHGESIVFVSLDNVRLALPKDVTLFIPDESELISAESILVSNFNKDIGLGKKVSNVKKRYWKFNRQYIGLIDESKRKSIIVNLLNFKCKKKSEKRFKGWQDFFFIGFGGFYEKNSIRIVINLSEQSVQLF